MRLKQSVLYRTVTHICTLHCELQRCKSDERAFWHRSIRYWILGVWIEADEKDEDLSLFFSSCIYEIHE